MKTMTRLAIAGIAALAAAGAQTGSALAQAFPTKQVTMLIPFAAGGPTDVVGQIGRAHV